MLRSSLVRLLLPLALGVAGLVPALTPAASAAGPDTTGILQAQRDHAARAGMATPPPPKGSKPLADAWPVGQISRDKVADLDADNRSDVIVVRDDANRTTTTVTVRRGVDGRVVWSKAVPYFVGLTPMRVASPSRPGVIIARVEIGPPDGGLADTGVSETRSITLVVTAYDGRSGAALWNYRRTDQGASARIETVLPGRDGRAGRLALMLPTEESLIAPSGQAAILSASTGKVRNIGEPGDYGDYWVNGGDIDNDGYADPIVSLNGQTDGPIDLFTPGLPPLVDERNFSIDTFAGALVAVSSSSGEQLWRGPNYRDASQIIPHKGDRGTVDLLFTSCMTSDDDGCYEWNVSAVNGRTGQGRWTWDAPCCSDSLPPVGDVDGDQIQDFYLPSDGSGPSCTYPNGSCHAVRSGANLDVLWQTRRFCFVRVDEDQNPDVRSRSDVQPDGVADFTGTHRLGPGGKCSTPYETVDIIMSGRDGSLQRTPGPLGRALGASVDGMGEDYLRWTEEGANITAAAVDGRTYRTLWTFGYRTAYGKSPLGQNTAQLNGDKKSEVILKLGVRADWEGGDVVREHVFLDGATGARLWTLPLNR